MFRVKLNALQDVPAESLTEASALCRKYLSASGEGSSAWVGGDVFNQDGNLVARISFNGRIWTPEPYPHCREIVEA